MKRNTREAMTKPVHELRVQLQGIQDELATLGFQLATRKMSNYARRKVLRRQIAQLKFFISEHERGQDAI